MKELKMENGELKIGTPIKFFRDLHYGACEDHPGFDYAYRGDSGVIAGEQNQFGYLVVNPGLSKHAFRARLDRDFIVDYDKIQ